MDSWMSTLDELLRAPSPEPHHVDLRVSEDFWDDETRDEVFPRVLAEFQADRARLAEAITARFGAPERRSLASFFTDDGPPPELRTSLLSYLSDWFFDVDLWRAGDRGIVAEVGHADRELPLQLMLVVGALN